MSYAYENIQLCVNIYCSPKAAEAIQKALVHSIPMKTNQYASKKHLQISAAAGQAHIMR